jgi:TRAP-type C4-dicarboxylate transport system permease small subunit
MASYVAPSAYRAGDSPPFVQAVEKFSTLAGWISALLIVGAVTITCQMIFVRFVLNGSTVWQTEAIIYLVIASTLFGLPFVQLLRGHVNVDLVPMWLPEKGRHRLLLLTLALSCGIVALMFFFGLEFWYQAYAGGWRSDTVWGVRLWIPYLPLPLGFGLLLLQLLSDLYVAVCTVNAALEQEAV